MLRLSFRSLCGDSPTLMLASCVRFCVDGTLRGPDNYVVARSVDGMWQVSGKLHREMECEGPVHVRLARQGDARRQSFGPFVHLHTGGGLLYGDHICLNIAMPGREPAGAAPGIELTLISAGGNDAKA